MEALLGDGDYGKRACSAGGIVATAAASRIPPPLVEQLKPGGLEQFLEDLKSCGFCASMSILDMPRQEQKRAESVC